MKLVDERLGYGGEFLVEAATVGKHRVRYSLDVKAWAASITRNGSSATVVNRAVGILAGILDDAVEHRALAFNPARRFKRGEKPRKSPNAMSISPRRMCAGWPRSPAVTPTWC